MCLFVIYYITSTVCVSWIWLGESRLILKALHSNRLAIICDGPNHNGCNILFAASPFGAVSPFPRHTASINSRGRLVDGHETRQVTIKVWVTFLVIWRLTDPQCSLSQSQKIDQFKLDDTQSVVPFAGFIIRSLLILCWCKDNCQMVFFSLSPLSRSKSIFQRKNYINTSMSHILVFCVSCRNVK